MFNISKLELEAIQMESLISQLTPEQSAKLRAVIIDNLLNEKTFLPNHPFFTAIKEDEAGNFNLLKVELIDRIKSLAPQHPAKQLML